MCIRDSLAVLLLDLFKLVSQSQGFHLGLEVGILTAGDLVPVDLGFRHLDVPFKAGIVLPGILPVVRELLQLPGIEAGLPVAALQGCYQAVHRGLAGEGTHAADGSIHNVHTGIGCHHQGSDLVAAGVVGVQMDGQIGHQMCIRDRSWGTAPQRRAAA